VLADFIIRNASEVLTCAGPAPRIGRRQADAGSRARAVVAARDGVIVFVGSDEAWSSSTRTGARSFRASSIHTPT
jgi:hypothetical protein